MRTKIKNIISLTRLNKPIGIFLLLWPTLWALWLAAEGKPDLKIVFIFVVGVVLMRSAGCVMNDIADRDRDRHVSRTRERPLALKKINIKTAIYVLCGLLFASFYLVLKLNSFTTFLSFVGIFLAAIYPLLKRVTHLPQLGLGVAFSWGIPMAFAAEQNALPFSCWMLFLTSMVWPVIYDTFYAMADRADDKKIGVKSSAILFGKYDRLIIALLQILFLILFVVTGKIFSLQWPFYLSLIIAGIFFIYQQWLVKERDPKKCFDAFINNHWVGLVIFIGIASSYFA